MNFSPELSLALDCCRWSFRAGPSEALPTLTGVNWPRFIHLAQFHRIEGLAWNALSSLDVPDEVRTALSAPAAAIAAHNLRAASECKALLAVFEAAEVPLLFLKGLTLGALVYGNPAVKSAIDVDLLIDLKDLNKAANLLRRSAYGLVAPGTSSNDESLCAWHVGWKESVWAKSSPSLQVDLHTRTADNPRLIPSIGVRSPRQPVDIGSGVRLPTLADEELFAYLAVHGASSAWFRLKWISDFGGFLHRRSTDEINHLYRRSRQLRAGRAAGQALLLADALFGTLENAPELKHELRSDRPTCWVFRAALRLLTGEPCEPTERRFGTLAIHWTQFLLLPGPAYKLSELKRQAARLH